jgi:Leucine-rich repeat (LRR) protein
MRITVIFAIFLASLLSCTLTFEQGGKSPEKSPALAALEVNHCGESAPYQGILTYLQAGLGEADCGSVLNTLAKVDYLDLSGVFAKDAGLWDEIEFLRLFPNIVHVKLSANKLSEVSALAHFTQLKYLYLDHNELESLEPLRALSLLWLDASHNQLKSIEPILGMASLRDLYLEGNALPIAPEQKSWPQLKVLRF